MFFQSCASSKHLQTRRYLDTLQGYLLDIQRILVSIHLEANARPAPFVDHAGILRDSKTGRPINGHVTDVSGQESDDDLMRKSLLFSPLRYGISWPSICLAGYSFFDSGDIELLGHRKKAPYSNVGEYRV
jgi:carnitine O-acetyltransferase